MKIQDADFTKLVKYMQDNFGINLIKKRALIQGRLANHIISEGYEGFHDFLEAAYSDKSGKMISDIVSRLTTNYTYFLREQAHYDFMLETALPQWTTKIKNYDLRVWSAGCSSGEEPYTTAMVIQEYLKDKAAAWDSTVLATDISTRVLQLAKAGVYPNEHLESLPKTWANKYFIKINQEQYRVTDELKKQVVFARFNLMSSFSRFSKGFHIIFCRNVMIYFDNNVKSQLTQKFYDVLQPGGYLFIGLSETLSGINNNFIQIAPAIYQKPLR